jgi:surface antigen
MTPLAVKTAFARCAPRPQVSPRGFFGSLVTLAARVLPILLLGLGGCVENSFEDEESFYARLADSDVAMAVNTMQTALMSGRDGHTATWQNDATAMRGAITPLRTFLTSRGYFCRAYREDIWLDRHQQSQVNTACLNDDGKWIWTGDFDNE